MPTPDDAVKPEGPVPTDYNGELPKPVLICHDCRHLRVHDFHYWYCRVLGDQTKPDKGDDPWDWWYNGGAKRLWSGAYPDAECPFPPRND